MRTNFLGLALWTSASAAILASACEPTSDTSASMDSALQIGDPCVANTECDDGLGCNGTETCVQGYCAAGVPVDCDDQNDCTKDGCDINGCIHAVYTSAHACSQQPLGYCHGPTCVSGLGSECSDSMPCSSSNNACTYRSCNNGYCVEAANPNGTACTNSNGDASQCYDGACEACVIGADCDDGNACTNDVCNSIGVCVNTSTDLASCAGGGFCWAGACCEGCIDNGTCVLACPAGTHCNENLTCVSGN